MIYRFNTVENTISNIKSNIVLFYGENLGIKKNLIDQIKTESVNAELLRFDQDDIVKTEENFFNKINNLSLFDERKIILIHNVNDKFLDIVLKIEEIVKDQKIFLFSSILEKKSKLRNYFEKSLKITICACYQDNENSLKKIILDKLKEFKGLNTENINLILNNCSNDRVKLDNEINKIFSYFSNKVLQRNKLELLLNEATNDDFNELKNEAINGNKQKTSKLLSQIFLDKDKVFFYLNMINQRFKKLYEIIELSKETNLNDALNNIRPPIFWKEKPYIYKQAKLWNSEKINEIRDNAYSLEYQIKRNTYNNNLILIRKFLIDICAKANAA